AEARVIDVSLVQAGAGQETDRALHDPRGRGVQTGASLPDRAVLHVGTASPPVRVRPLDRSGGPVRQVRLTMPEPLPWHVGDLAILRDPGDRCLWSVRVLDVDPLPLRRRGAAIRRAEELAGPGSPSDTRLRSRSAEHPLVLARLGLPEPDLAERVGSWWVHPDALGRWQEALVRTVRIHHADHPLTPGLPVAEAGQALGLPDHLRTTAEGRALPHDLPP